METILINLNSRNATLKNGSYKSNLIFNLKGLLKEEKDITNVYFELISASIPISFYNINETNNILIYTINSIQKNLILEKGNYNSNSLVTELTRLFLANSDTVVVKINGLNGKLKFSSVSTLTLNAGSTIMRVLGYDTNDIDRTSMGNIIIPDFPLNLSTVNQVIIVSNTLGFNSYNTNRLSGTLVSLAVNLPPFGILTFESSGALKRLLKTTKIIDTIDIKIYDENGNFINFNNQDVYIALSITIHKKEVITNNLEYSDVIKNMNDIILEKNKPKEKEKENNIDDLELLTN